MPGKPPVTDCDFDTSVPDRIIEYPETLSVYQEFGIDCSCGGKSRGYVYAQQGLDREMVLAALRSKSIAPRPREESLSVIKAEVSNHL